MKSSIGMRLKNVELHAVLFLVSIFVLHFTGCTDLTRAKLKDAGDTQSSDAAIETGVSRDTNAEEASDDDSDSDSDIDTEVNSNTDAETETDADTDTDAATATEADTDMGTEAATATDTNTDTGTEAATEAATDTDTAVVMDADTDADIDADTDIDAGVTWVSIPGGTFQMGSDDGYSDETPVHGVTVSAFELTKTEVTVTQYGVCVTAGACTVPGSIVTYDNWGVAGREDYPVNSVDWQQAVDFCTWIGGRLPSEAEWEYAARSGGQEITYPWGDEEATCTFAVMEDSGGWGCGTDIPMAVCSKTAGNTTQGLCDMAGNVWEWVQDWYHSDYTGAPTNGSAWEDPSGSSRVVRGGSFYDAADSLRATGRYDGIPSDQVDYFSFRCAK